MLAFVVEEQTNRLIEYAKDQMQKIGEMIQSYPKAHHMDDTGNLLDSLCWGVSYDGKLVEGGFFREPQASYPSYLHGRSYVQFKNKDKRSLFYGQWDEMDAGEPVYGHQIASNYINKYGGKCPSGQWKVFVAILAPYWGYWEKGFNMKGKHGSTFQRFIVMSQFYDRIKQDLKPARVRFRVSVAKYASKSLYAQARKNSK